MYQMLEIVTNNLEKMTTDRTPERFWEPNILAILHARSPRERETTKADAAVNDCPSPDRSKQKLNYGAPTESGNGAQAD
jgi:hypothetical protein